MNGAAWTARDEAYLCQHYGKQATPAIAAHLGRTVKAVRSRAKLRKFLSRKPWTSLEIAFVRRNAAGMTGPEIAEALGRPLHCVYQQRDRLGLSRPRLSYGAAFDAFLRKQHAAGWSDAEIAAAWSKRFPDHWPTERHTVGEKRQRLGLPDNALSDHRRRQVAAKTREQCKKAGLPSLAAVRVKSFRDRARTAGWPDDLRPRAVQILNALWDRGPMTRPEIAEAIGMPWKGSRKSLLSNDPEGSYLAHLQARGLVIAFHRACKVHGKGRGRSMNVYSLPLDIERRTA